MPGIVMELRDEDEVRDERAQRRADDRAAEERRGITRRRERALFVAFLMQRAAEMRQCVGCTCGGRGLCRDAA